MSFLVAPSPIFYAFILLFFLVPFVYFLFLVLLQILFSLTLFANLIKVLFVCSHRQLISMLNNVGFVAASLQILALIVQNIHVLQLFCLFLFGWFAFHITAFIPRQIRLIILVKIFDTLSNDLAKCRVKSTTYSTVS